MKTSDELFDDIISLVRRRTDLQRQVIDIEQQITAVDAQRHDALIREAETTEPAKS